MSNLNLNNPAGVQASTNPNLAGLNKKIQFNSIGGMPQPIVTPSSTPNGVKAKAPGAANQGIVNSIKPTSTAPQSQQITTSNQGTTPSSNNVPGSSVPLAPQVQPIQPQQVQPPTFGGIVGNLVNTAQNGGQQAQQYTQQGAQYGAGSIPIAAQANDIARQFGQKYADVGQQGAQFEAGQLTTGTSPVAQGNAAITAQTTAAKQSALAQGETAALQGIGYQLTGQQQAATAANAAAGQAYTGQGQTISGLNSAATQAAPHLGSIGQVPYNPLGGTQGDILGTQQPGGVQTAGNLLGQFQGYQALGAAPLQGQAAGAQAVAAAPGTTQAGIYGTQQAQQAAYQSALQQGSALQGQLSDLITNLNLNPADLNVANKTIQSIAANTSDPRYHILQNYVNDIANTYSQILTPPGGSATDTTRGIATSMLDATAKGSSILQVMQSLDQAARAKIATLPTNQGNLSSHPGGSQNGPLSWDNLGD